MARESEFLNDLLYRLAPLGARARSMFGGFGVYIDDTMMGLVADDVIYFKTGDGNRSDYEDMGAGPFEYTGKRGKPISMSYHQVPDDIFEDTDALIAWALKASAEAKASKKPAKPGRRRTNTNDGARSDRGRS